MKRLGVTLLLALAGTGGATTYEDMLGAIENARTRVIVYAPTIFDLDLANALRRAHLDQTRNVKVAVLTVPFYNYKPASTVLSLALANVPVYEAQVASMQGYVIVDDQGFTGNSLGRFKEADVEAMSPARTNKVLAWFKSALSKSKVLTQIQAFNRITKVTP